MLAVGALGFFGLGMGFFYECMLIAFAGIVFSTMVQGIWYSFRDKTISTFVLIIFLVLNISCGFGTFPSFMQFPIFQYISHIVPFNYLIHAEGAIIFNIASGTNVYENSMIVLKNVGILSIYLVGFFVLGMFMSKRRNREINYGTAKSKDLSLILMQMKLFDKYSTNHKLD
jgi:putative membrane protein